MIYIGGYENEHNQGIYELNDDLSLNKHVCDECGTSYFDVDENAIYTIVKRDGKGGVAIYDKNGSVRKSYLSEYTPACFIEKYENKIYVAYYHASVVQVFDLELNLLHEFDFPDGSKCHCVGFMHDKFVIVTLGLDQLHFYDYDFNFLFVLDYPKNSGPRHVCFSHDENEMYVLSELSNELFITDMYSKKIVQVLSIKVNEQVTTGAAIRLSKDGRHLYTSTRGQNIIKHFIKNEKWEEVQCVHLVGDQPRDFYVYDDCIVVGYQDSDLVEKIYLDENQFLSNIKESVLYDKIVCVK